MKRPFLLGLTIAALAGTSASLSGCSNSTPGAFDQSDPSAPSRLGSLVSISRLEKLFDDVPDAPVKPVERIECPQIAVLDGTSVHRIYNGAESNETLRYQYSLGEVARQCIKQGDRIGIKVGVEGRAVLGPAGTPGVLSVPIRVVVLKGEDEKPLVSKLYSTSVSFAPGSSVGNFTLVTEVLQVEVDKEESANDFFIKVGIDSGKGLPAEPRKRKRQ